MSRLVSSQNIQSLFEGCHRNHTVMKKIILIILVFISTKDTFGQINVNMGVDTSDVDVKTVIQFYTQYINEFKKGTVDYTKYFSAEECSQFKIPDKLAFSLFGNTPIYVAGTPTIIYIKPQSGMIHIKTHFGEADTLNKITTICIINHYVKFDISHKPYFVSPLSIHLKLWQATGNRNVTFYYPNYHTFDQTRSDSLVNSIVQLEKDWNLNSIPIRYLFAQTSEELYKVMGFDYNFMMVNAEKPTGLSDAIDNLTYSSGCGENYFHEVVHLYLNPLHSKSPLNEGIAVYYGGSMGQNLYWHLKRLNAYLIKHPKIDLNNPDTFYYMDNYTNPKATLCALICDLSYKRGGINKLKKIMTYTSMDELLKMEFNVNKEDWNAFYRMELKNYH